ncbi:hypothetical protein NP493_5643g00000 [Ridgeia piscesae]|uniref:Uncharacterized protein n=1 Tax=Ridgeia piscesae TaxID=27915 RepID=A0AAD9IV06_RIDPI|nr:hypothetical protein NP493_5643g00000 [Ridgeia piscesae]
MTIPLRQAYSVGSTRIALNLAMISCKAPISVIIAITFSGGDLSTLRPASNIRGIASMGIWNWAAPSTNSSRQPSSSRSTWSRMGRLRKAGTHLAHLTLMKRMRAAASQIASGLLKYAWDNSCGYCRHNDSG